MNRNVMIVLAGGFLIAVLVALLVQASLSGGKKEEPVVLKEEPKVQILVASKDLKVGAELSDKNMKWQDWPKNAVFPGAVEREDDKKPSESLIGRLRQNVSEGQPITDAVLVNAQGNFLAANLREGMRAVSVSITAPGIVSGFVGPGDYVDILLTYRRSLSYPSMAGPEVDETIQENVNNLATETIMQNVKVLAVDQSAGQDDEGGAKVGKTVTLEVDYAGAETLAIAAQMGTLNLALRRLGDEKVVVGAEKPPVTTDARITNLYGDVLNLIVDPPAEGENSTGKKSRFVRIYRGDEVEQLSVSP